MLYRGTLSEGARGRGRAIIKLTARRRDFLGGIFAEGNTSAENRARSISYQAVRGCCDRLIRTRVIGSRARAHVTRSLVLASGGSLVAKVAQRTDGPRVAAARGAPGCDAELGRTHAHERCTRTHVRTHVHTPTCTHAHATQTRRAVTRRARGLAN